MDARATRALEIGNKTDRLTRNDGARELEAGIAIPLWLPGERSNSGALANAQTWPWRAVMEAARLRLAATVREAWWNWERTRVDADIARGQLDNARRIATDVARRAGPATWRRPITRADGAVAAAEAAVARAEAETTTAQQQ